MSDDSEDEANLKYGTPLEPYDEDELPKKKTSYQDVREQYAVDSQGKRRFHGAFTGGFSAGFGNSVATPEGFTPATFKSSRSDRKQVSQRPQDFMDEEDQSEFGIAPKVIEPNKEFAGHKRKRVTQFHDGPIPGVPVLETLLRPVHETIAMRILKSMGWRPGKGIGEKVTAKERDRGKKVYTCFIPDHIRLQDQDTTENKSESEDEEYSNLLFEPNDLDPFIANPKTDVFGLGYSGLSRHSVLGNLTSYNSGSGNWQGSHLVTTDKGRKVSIRGQAFGVGALEEDDADIYAREDMSNYDFELGGPSKSDRGSSKKGAGKGSGQSHRKVLEGFVPASISSYKVKVYPPPALPKDYVPCPPKSSRFSATKLGSSAIPEIRDRVLGRHDLTAKHRGQILGEETVAAGPSSQTDPMDIDGKTNTIPGTEVSEKTSTFKPFASNITKQQRYERFLGFKEKGLSTEECGKALGFDKLAEWERKRELRSFEQAFKLYRPLTGLMSDRFVSASKTDDENSAALKNQDVGLSKYASDDKIEAARLGMFGKLTREVKRWIPESLLCKRFNVADPYNGGYASGTKEKKKLGYSIFEYLETPIHDKASYQQGHTSGESQVVQKAKETSSAGSVNLETEKIVQPSPASEETPKAKRLTTVEIFLQEKERERENFLKKPQLEFQKNISGEQATESEEVKETIDKFNKIDLYKAIFLSDSESDTEKEETPKPAEASTGAAEEAKVRQRNTERRTRFDSPPKNIERNTSPPKGIFANLNFERLNSWQNKSSRKDEDSLITKSLSEPVANPDDSTKLNKSAPPNNTLIEEGYYGPKLPEKPVFIPNLERRENDVTKCIKIDSSSSSEDSEGSWVDVSEVKSKKERSEKKNKVKKKKKHKHKEKKKHKKKKHKK